MSNLFFKSESVKKSVKSGLNLVSKQVFKAFFLMSMMLLSWNGWAQGYTVIYPDGQTMANPGDVVTVVFDEDASEFYYNLDEYQGYCDTVSEVLKHDLKLEVFGIEIERYVTYMRGIAPEPKECAPHYVKIGQIEGLSVGDDRFSIKVLIPDTFSSSVFDFYYGTKSDVQVVDVGQRQVNIIIAKWPEKVDEAVKKWTKSFTPKGVVRIDVVTDNLALRSPNNCYCPGDVVTLEVANNSYGDNLIWSYECGSESGEFKPAKVSENVYQHEIPVTFTEEVIVTCRGNVDGSDVAEIPFNICSPTVTTLGDCANLDETVSVMIEGTCPTLDYYVTDEDGNKVWPTTGTINGSTSYLAVFEVGDFEPIYEGQNDKPVGYRPKDFKIYTNGKHIETFQIEKCKNWIEECHEYSPAGNGVLTECSIAFDTLDSKVSFVHKSEEGKSGTPTDTIISFYKVDDGDWQSVNNSSRLEPCHSYQIRTNIYIDNINVGYCDSKPFEVKKPGGNQGPQVAVGYNPEVIAVSNGNCEFSVPDLTDSVKKYVTDECEFVVTQDVSVGEIVAVDSRMQVVATATGKCGVQSLTFNVNAPKALVIENATPEVSCDDENSLGKISGSFAGGVGPFTVTAAMVGGSPIDDSKISLSDRSFTITGLELGEYEVTVSDVNGCEVAKEVSVAVTPQELTIKGKNIEKIYNGQPQSAEVLSDTLYSVEGLLPSDVLSLTFNSSTYTDVDTVDYTIDGVKIMRGDKEVTCFYSITATGAKFMVSPRKVTLTSADDEKVYDGTALTNDEVTVSDDGFATGEGATYDVTGSQTEVGSSNNTFTYTLNEGTKAANYEITKEEGALTVTELTEKVTVTITENSGSEKYDGAEKTVTGYEVTSISNSLYTEDCFTFSGDATVKGTDAGSYAMELKAGDFTNTSKNFSEVEFVIVDGTLEISKRTVTLTSATQEKVYDRTALTNSTITVDGDGFVVGEGASYDVTGSQTEVGSSDNMFSYTLNEGTNDGNYIIEKVYGTLTILKPSKVQVTITEHGVVKTYNNEEYVVTGYDFATSNDLYTLSDFKFLGDSVVSGTNVGNYPMELTAEDFENLNENFEVEFNIVHNSLVINPLDVLVEITGNSLEVPYDKKEHKVSGYKWSANSDLYKQEYFEFGGDSVLAETNVGVYPMGLESDEFTNLDGNFKVTFNVVEDGSLTILAPSKVQVTITEHGAVKTYNNEEYVVTGYDFATSNDLYTLSDFKFLGDSVVSGTNVGNYAMGLKAEDFENINENFEVEFNIVHNSLVINPLDVLVEVTGNSSTEVYNGNQHTLSGYTWRANSNLYTEEDFTFGGDSIATGTIAGKYAMGLLAGEFININKNFNVNFSVVEDGELIISQLDVIVTIAGATKETHYTGSSQSISGYTWSSNTSTYTESDFTFSGNSLAYGINVGTYPMNLSADQFTNINKNFGKVTFVIEDGGITITPMVDEVVVRIAGHHEEVLYDGKEHTLTGYSLFTNHNLLTQDDIEFSGEEMAKAVNAGTYHLGLSVDQFKNTNKNFANVKFEVSDGTLIINKRHVLLESESKTQVYNGELFTHKVVNELKDGFAEGEGATYEFYAELLYAGEETNEFSYTLNEGTLAENYIIEEKYGTLTLAPVRKVIDIIANSAEKYHDRKPLSDPGYTYTEGVLIEGDTLIVEIEGVITEVGVTKNEIVSYRVMRGDIDVTDNYTFGTIKNGSLRVLHANHPTVVFVRDGKIIVHEAFEFVYVYDVLSRRVYLDGKAGVFIEEYGELDVPCTGAYVVIIGEESYKVVVHKK